MMVENNGEKTYLRLTVADIKEQIISLTKEVICLKTEIAKLSTINFNDLEMRIRDVEQKLAGAFSISGIVQRILIPILTGVVTAIILWFVFKEIK